MTITNKKVHSFTDDVIAELDAVGLSELIKKKELHPSEVVAASIARAKKVDPHLNAVVTERYEKALDSSNGTQQGFFAGIPTYIRRIYSTLETE